MTNEATSIFDGETLAGWHSTPRLYSPIWPGGPSLSLDTPEYREQAVLQESRWSVQDGAIVGEQWPAGSGYGGFLLSDKSYSDFELTLEAKPDWPADTGISLRKAETNWAGIQILLDHRQSGGIGGFYGNGIGGFHALPFTLRAIETDGEYTGIAIEDPAESLMPVSEEQRKMLSYAASEQEFLDAWRWGEWNEFKIRTVGTYPTITVWINGTKISEIDLEHLEHPHYDKDSMLGMLGRSGPIALEVHENDPSMGEKRWGKGAKCRWRNIRVLEL
ncbi:3-keto-disaccharide hydrolase [Homoserinimonas sp. A447]